MKVPHLMSIRPMECWLATPNASSPAMSYALEQTKAARIGVICQGASSAPHFLLARLQGYSFQFVFQVVFPALHLAASLLCSADCFQDILFEQAGNSHWNKLAFCFQNILFDKTGNSLWKKVAFLQRIKWHNWSAGPWKYLTWCQ